MINFRTLKSNLIQCRRQSQKIDQCEVGRIRAAFLEQQQQLSKLNGSIMMKLRKQMHTISDIDYKIQQINGQQTPFDFVKKLSELSTNDDPNLTKKFGFFKDQKDESAHFDCLDTVKKESTAKVNDIQNQSSILSNEDRNQEISIQSKLKKEENQYLNRQSPLKIKFIRINVNDGKFNRVSPQISSEESSLHSYQQEYERYVNQTFNSDQYDELRNYSPSQMLYEQEFDDQLFAPRSNDKQIVHIFSYSKEKQDLSPLSKITERSSEYMSPQPMKDYRNDHPEESLEYKKILYMLETTDRQKKKEKSQTTPSEFIDDDRKLENSKIIEKKRSITNKPVGKKEALNQIVNMLQTKYNRTLDLKKKNAVKAPKKK